MDRPRKKEHYDEKGVGTRKRRLHKKTTGKGSGETVAVGGTSWTAKIEKGQTGSKERLGGLS